MIWQGFSVGVVDRERILDSASMQAGDAIIALPSSGVHSNGFSLVRKVFDVENRDLNVYHEELGQTLGEALLTPTCIYVRPVQALLQGCTVRALAHITGGGFYENIPRSIPQGLCATIARADVRSLPVFSLIARSGNIPERDMFNTFNMGVGMAAVVPGEQADQAVRLLQSQGVDAYILGEITGERIRYGWYEGKDPNCRAGFWWRHQSGAAFAGCGGGPSGAW